MQLVQWKKKDRKEWFKYFFLLNSLRKLILTVTHVIMEWPIFKIWRFSHRLLRISIRLTQISIRKINFVTYCSHFGSKTGHLSPNPAILAKWAVFGPKWPQNVTWAIFRVHVCVQRIEIHRIRCKNRHFLEINFWYFIYFSSRLSNFLLRCA